MAGVIGIVAVLAAGESDRVRQASEAAEAAIWSAGFSLYELHMLSAMAAVARADLHAVSVEVVLCKAGRFVRDGVVVTGSRLPRGRAGATVAHGEGLAGRVLATGRTALEGEGREMATAIVGPYGLAGVVSATAAVDGPYFGAAQVGQLEALAADAGAKLGAAVNT